MLNPYANTQGTIFGGICGALLSGWISLGSQISIASGHVMPHKLDVSVSGCAGNFTIDRNYPDESGVFPLYRLSFHWITPIGVSTILIIGTIASYITGPRDLSKIDPELISPVIHRFLPKTCFANFGTENKTYQSTYRTNCAKGVTEFDQEELQVRF
jgi:sodium-coupled monocarboxylate transporter 8/12